MECHRIRIHNIKEMIMQINAIQTIRRMQQTMIITQINAILIMTIIRVTNKKIKPTQMSRFFY